MKLAEGKMDPIVAFTMQKLKVEGNIDKALRFKEIVDLKKKQEKKAAKSSKKTNTEKSTRTSAKAGTNTKKQDTK